MIMYRMCVYELCDYLETVIHETFNIT